LVSEREVREALRKCIDTELGINVVDLGLVYGIEVSGGKVRVRMTLTTPGCPLHAFFVKDVEEKVKELPGVEEAVVELVWEPPWSPEKMSEEAKKKFGIA